MWSVMFVPPAEFGFGSVGLGALVLLAVIGSAVGQWAAGQKRVAVGLAVAAILALVILGASCVKCGNCLGLPPWLCLWV